jgi:asparagine synthase (glutamine-hydrolysing)
MCGITGFVDFDGHDRAGARARIKQMTDMLVHRGPDAEGYYVDDLAALGHRRLSIIDLGTGQQPMGALGGRVQIVFNGEIYNFTDLRSELEQKGHEFRTRSDTEVILRAYLEWGERCVSRLNGMFAFAIWDGRSKRLVLARDRVGKKPLYYYHAGSVVAFASELKALRAGGLCPSEIDPESLDCYFSLGFVPAPRTIYREVHKLRAAHVLVVAPDRREEHCYWQLVFGGTIEQPLNDAVDELEGLLDDAVRRRLMSEVPLGAFLSGGLDSSLVVSSMSRLLDQPVTTHTIGFDEPEHSELTAARAIADHLGTRHHEFIVSPRVRDVLGKIAWHLDEPLADSSALPTWYVCEMTKRSVTVALSGDGGDEGFGGYTFRYLPHVAESKIRAALPAALRSVLFGPLSSLWPASARLPRPLRLKTILENLTVGDSRAFYCDLVSLREDARAEAYSPEFMKSLLGFTPFEIVDLYYSSSAANDPLSRSQLADIHLYMTDDILVKVDRMSMAHSLEVRCPLLDHRVLEFAARLPTSFKVSSTQGKRLLRALAARRLPAGLDALPKRGFSVPLASWLRDDLRPLVEDVVSDKSGSLAAFMDTGTVRRMWREHQSLARDHSAFLWALIMLELWKQQAVATVRSGSPVLPELEAPEAMCPTSGT